MLSGTSASEYSTFYEGINVELLFTPVTLWEVWLIALDWFSVPSARLLVACEDSPSFLEAPALRLPDRDPPILIAD
jgi:hypothetical protein